MVKRFRFPSFVERTCMIGVRRLCNWRCELSRHVKPATSVSRLQGTRFEFMRQSNFEATSHQGFV
ncbi:hypothetical protein C0Z19_13875 [Trinickia soli]|uniref:Transposase n=1 Tax=Trinickia soli TaxID=380675 RepID=A0A2N7W4N2_9BURK|nr:hypothetical protein C0Z19_13875 [Trinickia soli]